MAREKLPKMMYFSAQDYRTSALRMRSIMTGDRDLRIVYSELLFALWEQGGYLPADSDQLVDILGLPLEVIERTLPIIEDFGRRSLRGGIHIEGGKLWNQRILEDLERELQYREQQALFGARGGVAKAKGSRRVAQGSAKGSVSPASTTASASTSGKTDTTCLPGSPEEEPKARTPQQVFVDSAWALFDRFGARRPQAGLLGAWANEFCKGDRDWLLREIEDLGLSGHLAKGSGYIRQALAGVTTRRGGGAPVNDGSRAAAPALTAGTVSLDGTKMFNGVDWDPLAPEASA